MNNLAFGDYPNIEQNKADNEVGLQTRSNKKVKRVRCIKQNETKNHITDQIHGDVLVVPIEC